MKNLKRLVSIMLTLIFVINIGGGLPVSAQSESAEAILESFMSEEALFIERGRTANKDLVVNIQELDILVKDDTLIEVVPVQRRISGSTKTALSETSGGNVYRVTNVVGNNVTQDFILMYEYKNDEYVMIDVLANSASETLIWPSGKPLTVTGGISYNVYMYNNWLPLYCPQFCWARISQVNSGLTCTVLTGAYQTNGSLYAFDLVTVLESDYQHLIGLAQTNPAMNQLYTRERPLSAGAIQISGSPFAGAFYTIGYNLKDSNGNIITDEVLVIK